MKRPELRTLLWFDCSAAAVVGAAMLALSGPLAALLGLPRAFVVFNAVVNLAYGTFSFSLARQASPPRRRVRVLVVANFVWAGVCLVTALHFARPESWLGAGYILAEGFFVGTLAAAEARALAAVA